MATAVQSSFASGPIADLHSGDRMTRAEFHRIYAALPKYVKAELIGGIVYVPSPLSRRHATNHLPLNTLFFLYKSRTLGVEGGDNGTILLGDESEPQPDLYLRILPEFGGQSRTEVHGENEYVAGAPELVVEIAHSSRAIDLHAKKDDYARHGVIEYIVVLFNEKQVRFFELPAGRDLAADADAVFRSRVFPGLWIHTDGLLEQDASRLIGTLEQGLATPEHAEFVRRLAATQKP